ncbi:MAG TPA: succinate dehydrogenase cytochrome b subunit [Gemmatirosa sp.]
MQLVRNFWQSQLGKKVVMAVTGLIGVGFVIGHMAGNLQIFEGPERFNSYAHLLHGPLGNELWIVRLVLISAVVLHVIAAVQLTRQKQAARPAAYGYKKWEPQVSTFASRSIRWGGAYLLVWLVFHILHFTARAIFPDYSETDAYGNVVKGFSHPWVVALYVVAMFFLGLHLYHGAWSSVRTLGLSRPRPRPTSRSVATVVAALVSLGFVAVPLAVLFGAVRPRADSVTAGVPAGEAGPPVSSAHAQHPADGR